MDLMALLEIGPVRRDLIRDRLDTVSAQALACTNRACRTMVSDELAHPRPFWVPFPKNSMVGIYPAFGFDSTEVEVELRWWDYDPAADVIASRTGLRRVTVWLARAEDGSRRRTDIDLAAEVVATSYVVGLHDNGRILSLSCDTGVPHLIFYATDTGERVFRVAASHPRSHPRTAWMSGTRALVHVHVHEESGLERQVIINVRDPSPLANAMRPFSGGHMLSMRSMALADDGASVVTAVRQLSPLDCIVVHHDGQCWTHAISIADFEFGTVRPHAISPQVVAMTANARWVRVVLSIPFLSYHRNLLISWMRGSANPPTLTPFVGTCCGLHDGQLAYFTPTRPNTREFGQLCVVNLECPGGGPPRTRRFKPCHYLPLTVDLHRRAVVVADARTRLLMVYPL